jgi:hypothetical protein
MDSLATNQTGRGGRPTQLGPAAHQADLDTITKMKDRVRANERQAVNQGEDHFSIQHGEGKMPPIGAHIPRS